MTNLFNKKVTYDVTKNVNKFPIMTVTLLFCFYIIGLLTLDTSRFSSPSTYRMDTYIIKFPQTVAQFTINASTPIHWQWQVFTYYLFHFAIVHYGYSGLLLLYYVQGLEKATSKKLVLTTFLLTSVLAPILIGPLIYALWYYYLPARNFFFVQSYYLGSSVGIWGCMGLTCSISRKRRFYWVIIFLLLFPEFILKIYLGTGDIMANVVHVIVYTSAYLLSRRFIVFTNNNKRVGELKINWRYDLFLIAGIIINGIILIIYFIDLLGIFRHNLLYYIFQ